MSRDNVCLLELVEQLVYLTDMVYCANDAVVVKWDMHAQYYGHTLWHYCEVLLEPFVLRVEESARIISHRGLRVVDDVAHTDDVNIASVERVVDWAIDTLKLTLCADVVVAAMRIWLDRAILVVVVGIVVTHNLKYWHTDSLVVHCATHLLAECLAVAATRVGDDITQGDTITRDAQRLDMCCDAWYSLLLESSELCLG